MNGVLDKERRTALDRPTLKVGFLKEILSNLQGVVGAVPAPEKTPPPLTREDGACLRPAYF